MSIILWVIVATLALVVWRITKQIYRNYQCVDEEILKDYLYGKVRKSPGLHRQVTTHLGLCEKCQEKLFRIQKGRSIEDHLVDSDSEID